jgi:hypothetical protein
MFFLSMNDESEGVGGRASACRRRNLAATVNHAWIRIVFMCSAALLAAVLGDAVLEGISNAGIFWHGHYTDRSSLNLLPVFLLAVLAVVATLGLSVYRQARETGVSARSLLISSSRALSKQDVMRLLPTIFLLQMLVLFSMETAEQVAVYGHVFGGTLWMGAPVVASLFGHAFFTVVSAFSLSSGLETLTKALVRIVKCLFMLLAALADARPMPTLRPEGICAVQLLASAVVGERGPPLFIAL